MTSPIVIDGRAISRDHPPYVIAEMSGNHNQSLEQALAIVDAAAATGVHALKLQTYTADTMTINVDCDNFMIQNTDSLWHDRHLYQLYEQAHTPWDWHSALFARAHEHGLTIFSTPFDRSAVDFLETLEVPAYKIGSFENVDLGLIEYVAQQGKPVILSTGMATVAELHDAVTALRDNGCEQFILLKCTSAYPTPASQCHLQTLPHMQQLFSCPVGLSDHTLGIGVAVASVPLGAVLIEKHFTMRRSDGGVDAAFSMEPDEMQALVTETDRAWQAQGQVHYGITDADKDSPVFRRSLYFVEDVSAGEVLQEHHVRVIRPGYGLAPKFLPHVMGRTTRQAIKRGTPVDWSLLG